MSLHVKRSLLSVLGIVLFLSGCAEPQKPLYYYGDYSERYYAFKKYPGQESDLLVQRSMEQAIENAQNSSSGRVPPGMYANLGYFYLKSSKPHEAINLFKKEKTLYPESAHFMDRMIKKVQAAQGHEDE